MLYDHQPKTQKAKGLALLSRSGSTVAQVRAVQSATLWPYEEPHGFPVFARPCPVTPRHGFVDSRLVNTQAEWEQVCAEAVKADPEAEVIAMPFIDPAWSAILTPAGLTIGPGNDGATSGHGAKMIPATATKKDLAKWLNLDFKEAGVKDTPYVELVKAKKDSYDRFRPQMVQVRDGPEVVLASSYVPEAVTVAKVVEAKGDLLEWEALAKTFTPGTVVWHPGGSMQSHYAVHCVLHKVPIVCKDEAPKVGEVLEPQGTTTSLSKQDYAAIAQSILQYRERMVGADAHAQAQWCAVGTSALHAQTGWGNEAHLLRLRAAGVMGYVSLASAACLGEARHFYGCGPGSNGQKKQTCNVPGLEEEHSRSQVYTAAFKMTLPDLVAELKNAYNDFMLPGWSASYGGKAWARCTNATMHMVRAVMDFIANPKEAKWTQVVTTWNRVVNSAHNSGVFLNKFQDKSKFDLYAAAPVFGLMNDLAASIVMEPSKTLTRAEAKALRVQARALRDQLKDKAKRVKVDGVMHYPPGPEVPHGPWPKFLCDGDYAAQFKTESGVVHVQVKMDYPVNRPYGAVFNVPGALFRGLDLAMMQGASRTVGSLNDGHNSRKYTPCAIRLVDGRILFAFEGLQFPVEVAFNVQEGMN